jgi:hypothetical protein
MPVLVFQSCNSAKEKTDTELHLLSVPTAPSDTSYFEKHFEIAEIIPIETTDSFLVADVKKLIRYEDRIFLLSGRTNAVFVINKNGKIEHMIHRPGTGPGESRTIMDIAFDNVSQQLVIYNDYSKLLFFDLQGQFLSETKTENDLYEGISIEKGKVFFHNKLEGYSCYPYGLKVFNIKDKTWEDVGRKDKLDFSKRTQGRYLVNSKRLWFTVPLDFNFYTYQDGQIQTPYQLDLPKIDEELVKKSAINSSLFFGEVIKDQLIYSINSVRETTDFLVFRSNKEGFFIVNKKENKIYWDRFVNEYETLATNLTFYYPHDGDDDKIMFVLTPDASNVGSLKEIAGKQIKEDDNPILIFYKQK